MRLRMPLWLVGGAALTILPCGSALAQNPPPARPAEAPLTLPAAVASALATNPSARAASQQVAQAQAKVAQAEAQGHFQITFNSTVSGSDASVIEPPPSHETFGTLQNTLTVPLPIGSKPRLALLQAQAQLAAAQAQFAAARLTLSNQVSTAYYDLLRKQALVLVARDTLDQAQRQLSEAQKRNRAGDVPALDVLRAQVPVASAQAGLQQAETNVTVAKQTLNSLLRRPLDAPLTVADVPSVPAALPYTQEQARAIVLQRSPDIRAAEATVRADEAARESTRRWQEPAVSLQASDTRSNDQTGFSRLDSVEAALTVPISDGGLGRAQIREAEAALEQAKAQAETARQTALLQVSAAYLTAQGSGPQLQAARTAQDIAQTAYEQTIKGYQNGLFPLADVLTAQAALTQARIAYTQAVYDAAVARNALTNAVGKEIP